MFGFKQKASRNFRMKVQSFLPESEQIDQEFELGLDTAYLTDHCVVGVDLELKPPSEEISVIRYDDVVRVAMCSFRGLKWYSFAVKITHKGGEVTLKSNDENVCKALVTELLRHII